MIQRMKLSLWALAPICKPMIKEMLQTLAEVPKAVWDTYALRHEPLSRKLTTELKTQFLELAQGTGKELAHEVEGKYPKLRPVDIVTALGLNVNYLEDQDDGNYTMFACYTEPDNITIYKKTVDALEAALREADCIEILNGVSVTDVLLAHELYHYFEFIRPEMFTNQKLLTLWHIGNFSYKSKVVSLKEIGAMTFTQELLHLPYSPYVFDVLLLYPQNKRLAKELFDYVKQLVERQTSAGAEKEK